VGGQANGGAGIAEIDANVADSCFNSPNDCGTGDDMGVNPRLAASAGMTGAGVAAVEGSAYGCTDGYVGGSSEGRSVGVMASAGGGIGGSSNRTDGCDGGDGCALADLMPAMTSILYMRSCCSSLIVCRSATIVVTFWIRDLHASCTPYVVVAMAMRTG
jgi:hypothetical protein